MAWSIHASSGPRGLTGSSPLPPKIPAPGFSMEVNPNNGTDGALPGPDYSLNLKDGKFALDNATDFVAEDLLTEMMIKVRRKVS